MNIFHILFLSLHEKPGIQCPSDGSNYAGDETLINGPAALLGSIACVDASAVSYRNTLTLDWVLG